MSVSKLEEAYRQTAGLRDDPAQRAIVRRLVRLQRQLRQAPSFWTALRRRLPGVANPPPVRGLYLWGGVGRGKTFLMDLFYQTLDVPSKRRIHFHRIMHEVHARLARLDDVEDPLDVVAAQIASDSRVLCFDEFFVNDIGDAMILGRLLDGLFRRGVTLVTTSNVPPDGLYADGLQRQRFLPAIELLETHTDVVELDGGLDYRLELLQQAGTYLTPADTRAEERLAHFFEQIAPAQPQERQVLEINGRDFETRRAAKGVAWFDFAELCEKPRSQSDYIELARWYHTVIVSGIPALDRASDDATRRLISLIDEFYDRRVKLVVSAAHTAHELYRGQRLAFEFQRTISRLTEMQSAEYLHAAHRG
jgi:cell division protein ZapE